SYRLDARRVACTLDAFVPARRLQRFDESAHWPPARGERGAGHIPITDVTGRENDALADGVGSLDVLPAIDSDVVDQLARFEVGQADQVDHVACVVREGGPGEPARVARVSLRAENLSHIVGGAAHVVACKHLK